MFEVQRAEGLRLWFEVLAWGMGDRAGEKAFEVSVVRERRELWLLSAHLGGAPTCVR